MTSVARGCPPSSRARSWCRAATPRIPTSDLSRPVTQRRLVARSGKHFQLLDQVLALEPVAVVESGAAAAVTPPPGLDAGRLSVLVVDDEPPARAELAWLLQQDARVGIVRTASGGAQALRLIEQHPIDAVFSDIRMPGVDGLELARALSRAPRRPHIVFVTAYDRHAVDAFDLQAIDYLMKPVRAERLAEAVRRVHLANRQAAAAQLRRPGPPGLPPNRPWRRRATACTPATRRTRARPHTRVTPGTLATPRPAPGRRHRPRSGPAAHPAAGRRPRPARPRTARRAAGGGRPPGGRSGRDDRRRARRRDPVRAALPGPLRRGPGRLRAAAHEQRQPPDPDPAVHARGALGRGRIRPDPPQHPRRATARGRDPGRERPVLGPPGRPGAAGQPPHTKDLRDKLVRTSALDRGIRSMPTSVRLGDSESDHAGRP